MFYLEVYWIKCNFASDWEVVHFSITKWYTFGLPYTTCLVTFMLYSCEYKQGRHAEELNTLEIGKNKVDINSYAWRGKNAKDTKENNQKDYETIFKEKYYKVYSAFRPCPLLIEYIESGNLDEERFKKEIGKLDDDISKQIISKEGKVYQRLLNMSELNDEDVAYLLDEMMEFVKGDKYNLYELLNLYALLLKYDYWNVGGFELTDKLDGEFRLSMQRQKVNHRYDDFFEGKIPIFDNSSQSRSQYQRYNTMKNVAICINRQVKNEDEIEKGKVFLLVAESGNVDELRNYRIDTNKYIPLAGLEWNRLTDLIKTAPNPVACELCECLMSFLSEPGAVKPDDRVKIKEELLPSLEEYLKEKRPQIRRMYVAALKDVAEGILE